MAFCYVVVEFGLPSDSCLPDATHQPLYLHVAENFMISIIAALAFYSRDSCHYLSRCSHHRSNYHCSGSPHMSCSPNSLKGVIEGII